MTLFRVLAIRKICASHVLFASVAGTAAGDRGIRDQSADHGSVHRRPDGARVRREGLRLPFARHQGAARLQRTPELVRHGGLPRLLVGESHGLDRSRRDRHADGGGLGRPDRLRHVGAGRCFQRRKVLLLFSGDRREKEQGGGFRIGVAIADKPYGPFKPVATPHRGRDAASIRPCSSTRMAALTCTTPWTRSSSPS